MRRRGFINTVFIPRIILLQRAWRKRREYNKFLNRAGAFKQVVAGVRAMEQASIASTTSKVEDAIFSACLLSEAFATRRGRLEFADRPLFPSEEERRAEVSSLEEAAAVTIQARHRGVLARRRCHAMRCSLFRVTAANVIKTVCRRYMAQASIMEKMRSGGFLDVYAKKIQSAVRRWQAMRHYYELRCGLRKAVLSIKRQADVTSTLQHQLYIRPVLKAQNEYRLMTRHMLDMNRSVVFLQSRFRGYYCRSQFNRLKDAAGTIQKYAWTTLLTNRMHAIRLATLRIQRSWRAIRRLRQFSTFFGAAKKRKKDFEAYSVRETRAVQLLRQPLLSVQGFFNTSVTAERHDLSLHLVAFETKQNLSAIYPSTWAWPIQNFIRERAVASRAWQLRRAPHMHSGMDPHSSHRHASLKVEQIILGGHHTLILLEEYKAVRPLKDTVATDTARQQYPAGSHLQQRRNSGGKSSWVRSVYTCGLNDRGQLGDPFRAIHPQTTDHNNHAEEIKPVMFVDDAYRRYNTGTDMVDNAKRLRGRSDFTHSIQYIAAGESHCIAVTTTGAIFSWGCNQYGQCGVGARQLQLMEPNLIPALRGLTIIRAASGPRQCLAADSTGTVHTWGAYTHVGLETVPVGCNTYTPTEVPVDQAVGELGLPNALCCSSGFNAVSYPETRAVLLWGRNDTGQIGNRYSGYAALDDQSTDHQTTGTQTDTGTQESTGDSVEWKGLPAVDQAVRLPVPVRMREPFGYGEHPTLPAAPRGGPSLSVRSVECGMDFVVVCIKPSRGRIFLWGHVSVYDPVPPATETPLANHSRLLNAARGGGAKAPPVVCQQVAVRHPVAVRHELWIGKEITSACPATGKSIACTSEDGSLYGFSSVTIQRPSGDVSEDTVAGTQSPRPSATTRRSSFHQNTAPVPIAAPVKVKKRPPYCLPELTGFGYHFIPNLYSFITCPPEIVVNSVQSTGSLSSAQVLLTRCNIKSSKQRSRSKISSFSSRTSDNSFMGLSRHFTDRSAVQGYVNTADQLSVFQWLQRGADTDDADTDDVAG